MGRVSASRSALLLSPCLRSFWDEAREYEDEFADTTKRERGTELHAWADAYYRGHVVSDVPNICGLRFPDSTPLWFAGLVEWSQKHLEPRCETIQSEVYVAINPVTGEVHSDESVHDRKYPDMPGYIPGTADLVCVLKDGSLLVADWKTGGATGADKQLLTLAIGLRHMFRDADSSLRPVRLAVLYVGDDGVRPHEWAVTDAELEAHQFALGAQMVDVGVRTGAVPGIWCTQLYCKHLAYCPAMSSIVERAAEEPIPAARLLKKRREYDLTSDMNDSSSGSIMERITAAKRFLTFHEGRVRAHLDNGGRCISGSFEFSKGRDGARWRVVK